MQTELLKWYRANKRDLPWRRMQDDPYAVWVSEVMLQQTQVKTVIPYFERWMARFPTMRVLADSSLDDVLAAWSGLGYYARARNLHRAAREVMGSYGGRIPADSAELSRLPGIGQYTRGAVLSIAFNRPEPVVDANVARVLSRIYALNGDPKATGNQKRLWSLAEDLMPHGQARDFNQALMELGALVCSSTDPDCERCPILSWCKAGKSADPTVWPQIPPGRRTVRVSHSSAIIVRKSHALMVKRPAHGLWGGLWELPRRACELGESPEACAERAAWECLGIKATTVGSVARIKHSVTHHAITLHGILVTVDSPAAELADSQEIRWVSLKAPITLPISSPQRILLEELALYEFN